MSERHLLILKTAFSDHARAEKVAELLVDAGLAVSAQVEGVVLGIFRDQGLMHKVKETPVTFNVLPVRLELFLGELKLQHPHETPRILGWPATQTDQDYLNWAKGKNA